MGHTTEQLEKIISEELNKLKAGKVTAEELKSAKVRMKVGAIKQMTSNRGLLSTLLSNEILTGSWENAFNYIQKIEKVTVDDLKELAEKYFTLSNRVVIKIEKKGEKNK